MKGISKIKYAFLCEDEAQQEFLRCILPLLAKFNKIENVEFIEVNTGIEARDDFQVDTMFNDACRAACINYNIDLFFIFRDVDSNKKESFKECYRLFDKGITEQHRLKTIISLPMPCIEHWLWYIKIQNKSSQEIENIIIESEDCNSAKNVVYNRRRLSNRKQKPLIRKIIQNVDFGQLSYNSISFKTFQCQLIAKLNEILH